MPYFVYILHCGNGEYYTGLTNNIRRRLTEHQSGVNKNTSYLRPLKLIFYICFPNKKLAADFEQYLKTNSGRAFRNKHLILSLKRKNIDDKSE